jgi:hypothetical protein
MRFEPLPHLGDDHLMECNVLASDHQHLAECGRCKARFDDLARALEQIREDALHEADAVFTNERLHDQRDRILRRIERQGHPAEVLLFPGRAAQHPVVRRVIGPARRWVAGAAAAGLAAGLFLGFAMDRRASAGAADHLLQAPAGAEVIARARYVADSRDEQILWEIEDALAGPRRLLELRAIDVMTTPPELQEASLDIR